MRATYDAFSLRLPSLAPSARRRALFGGDATGTPTGTTPPPNCEETGTTGAEPAECAELEVTKVVTGTAPPGTTFPVVVDCEDAAPLELPPGIPPPFTQTLTFTEGGGILSIFITTEAACTITETPPAGCTLVSIDPPTVEILEPALFTVTVTNNCEVAAAPAAIPAAPTFTG